MSDMSPKTRLQEAIRRLEAWEGKLPGFSAFHVRRTAVLDNLHSHSGSFFKLAFANKDDLRELVQQANSVDQLGAGLDEIFQKISQLQADVAALRPLLRAQDSGPFAAAVEQRHNDWLAQLEPLGRDVARSSELKTPRSIVQSFQHLIPRDKVALELLAEATEALSVVEQEVGRVGLEGDIKRWREEFVRSGAPHHWAEQVRQELDAYRKKREEQDRRQQNQPGRKELASLEREAIPLATYWAHVLDEFRNAAPPTDDDPAPADPVRRIGKLSERTRQALSSRDTPAEAAEELGREVMEVLDSLSAAASARSGAALLQLRKRLGIFCDACETGPERDDRIAKLDADVRDLDGREMTRPDEFEGFAAALSEAKTEFEGLAANQRGRLSVAANDAIRECSDQVNRLLDAVHPQAVTQTIQARRAEIPAEPDGEPQAQESLRLLEVCDWLSAEFERLAGESAAAMESFQAWRLEVQTLCAGAASLSQALGRPAPAVEAVAATIAALESPAGGAALEDYERQLTQGSSEVGAVLEVAYQQAQSTLQERQRFCLEGGRALKALQRIQPALPELPDSLDGLTPQRVRELLEDSKASEAVFGEELASAATALRQQTDAAAAGLKAFIDGVAEEGDSKRLWAEDLLGELEDSIWLEGVDSATQVLHAATWMEGHHTFQEDLRRNETRARELREQLRTLQLEIQKDSRHRYCPELFERARRLLEGVPEEPADWQQAVTQFGEAERSLRLADAEARRRIALELRETRKALLDAARRASDPSLRTEIEAKLAKLDDYPTASTPPNAVRRPLIYQARQLGVGGLRGRR